MDVNRDEDKEGKGGDCKFRRAGTDLEEDKPSASIARARRLRRRNNAAVPKLSFEESSSSIETSSSSSSTSRT